MTAPTLTVTINEDHWVAWVEVQYEEYVNYFASRDIQQSFDTFNGWFTAYRVDLMQEYLEDRTLLQ